MMRRFALVLCDFATGVLPAARKRWGKAMAAELQYVDDSAALAYACGCAVTAIRERTRDFDTRFITGLWLIAIVTGLLAITQIACAVRGVEVLFGAPDGMYDSLVRKYGAKSILITNYVSARPVVIGSFFFLGSAHLAAAFFLIRAQFHLFLIAWCAALLIAIVAVAAQLSIIWNLDGVPLEFQALLVQALALPALLAWSNGRHVRGRSLQ